MKPMPFILVAALLVASLPLACGPNYNHGARYPVSPTQPDRNTPTPYFEHIRTFGDTGYPGTGNGQFQSPSGVAFYNNYFFVADRVRNDIQRFDYYGYFSAAYTGAGFDAPEGIAFSGLNLLFVADSGNDRIQVLDINGNVLDTFGSSGAAPGQFDHPLGLAVDADSNVYVADNGNARLQKCGPDGTGCVTVGGFTDITGVAVDESGCVWAVDRGAKKVLKFTSALSPVTQFGTAGPGSGEFSSPFGIAVDSYGNFIVTDAGNANVQMFGPAGDYLNSAGIAGPGSDPGQFDGPGFAVLYHRNLFVSDTVNANVLFFYLNYY